ncbi:transposase [Tissierella sp.]|uniref:transposase n=1 Tax=Tissierella sp. TaxID=41274 RepID=UPI0028B17645|nr:transposase [Tissierella sp.]
MVSSVSAAQILKSDMTIVSKGTICNLLKKMPVSMDKNGIIRVCIDDFAFKKRYSYGTIMVDLDSHRIIDILDSRDKEPVIEWLRNYPSIEIVSRDGSQVYASAITEAHPGAVQISDRFHLLKNLSEAVGKYMFRLFPARVEIPATATTRTPTTPIRIIPSNQLKLERTG